MFRLLLVHLNYLIHAALSLGHFKLNLSRDVPSVEVVLEPMETILLQILSVYPLLLLKGDSLVSCFQAFVKLLLPFRVT